MSPEEYRAAANLVRGLRQVGDDLVRVHESLAQSLALADALLTRAERVLGIVPAPSPNHRPPPA